MQYNVYNLKISKELIRKYGNTKEKTLPVLAYLYFHTTSEKYIYTSVDCICSELNLSTKSHGHYEYDYSEPGKRQLWRCICCRLAAVYHDCSCLYCGAATAA